MCEAYLQGYKDTDKQTCSINATTVRLRFVGHRLVSDTVTERSKKDAVIFKRKCLSGHR